MSRKSLIICFSALAAMVVMIVAAVAFLYCGDDGLDSKSSHHTLAYAVPSNSVMVCFLSDASNLSAPVLSSFDFNNDLADFLKSESAGNMGKHPLAVSLHYSGSLSPLYVFDAGSASDVAPEGVPALLEFAKQHGYQAEFVNCSEAPSGSPLATRSVALVAKTKAQLSIAKSHIREGRSVMDADGFADVVKNTPSDALLYSYGSAKVLFEKAVQRSYFTRRFSKTASAEYSDAANFFHNLADWGAVSLTDKVSFDFVHDYTQNSDFMSVMNHASPSVSEVSKVLPSYTRFALSLPMNDASVYLSSYDSYLESVKKKPNLASRKFIDKLGVKEVASAAFVCDQDLQWVNLVKVERADTMLLRGTGDSSFGKSPKVRPYRFAGNIASVFGKVFRLEDESHFAYMNGWLITGSQVAVEEYVSGKALSYDLKTYMEDAGKEDLLADRVSACVVYANIPKGDKWLSGLLGKEVCKLHDAMKGTAEYSPVVMSVFSKEGIMHTDLSCSHLKHLRSRAPKFERDTVVNVPSGPFEVLRSDSGRPSMFYQQSNGAICLKDENGRGLWGVPFKKSLCGTAHTIDYYANGKRQILFGAGSGLYLIDRSGRFVKDSPADLGKEILLGPDVYEFNGTDSYNVMVLHKDNTVEMYDLQGNKPGSWKGISCKEKIKSLPERLVVGDKSVWVVRTSIQTLIYPFNGGSPLSTFKEDMMFLPTAEVKVKNSNTVEAACYDGKVRAVKIK